MEKQQTLVRSSSVSGIALHTGARATVRIQPAPENTGIIFRGYTYGTGEEVVQGGRYDDLLQKFGKSAPAVGLAVRVDQLLTALIRQKLTDAQAETDVLLLYPASNRPEAIRLATILRDNGRSVQLTLFAPDMKAADYTDYARRFHIREILSVNPDGSTSKIEVTEGGQP